MRWEKSNFLFIFYWTGMSDLCSPMVILLENEADAFWCFERLMYRLVSILTKDNFSPLPMHVKSGCSLDHLIGQVWILDDSLVWSVSVFYESQERSIKTITFVSMVLNLGFAIWIFFIFVVYYYFVQFIYMYCSGIIVITLAVKSSNSWTITPNNIKLNTGVKVSKFG